MKISFATLVIAVGLAVGGHAHAQAGKDGNAGAFTAAPGTSVLNSYAVLAADAAPPADTIDVGDVGQLANGTTGAMGEPAYRSAALEPGDLLFIYQAQGATIDTPDSPAYGAVNNIASAGRFEFAVVQSVAGNTIKLTAGLRNAYTVTGQAQVVRVPQYKSLTVPMMATLSASAWSETAGRRKGGVLVLSVQGAVVIDGVIQANALGFRGGQTDNAGSTTGITSYRSGDNTEGAEKGESVAGFAAEYNTAGRFGRGAPANGGGGGNAHNAGGGGGANGGDPAGWNGQGVMSGVITQAIYWARDPYVTDPMRGNGALATSTGGGRGGYTFGSAAGDAGMVAPGNGAWGGDDRREVGGLGGRPLTQAVTGAERRLFLGGGGGAGDGNNGHAGAGGAGGGLIFLVAQTVTGSGAIAANGGAGENADSSTDSPSGDAPGGGGAGGTIVVTAMTLTGVSVSANGGVGGNQIVANGQESEGPGGGGGGGYVSLPMGSMATALSGAAGTTTSPAVNEWPQNGASDGSLGRTADIAPACAGLEDCPFDTSTRVTISTPLANAFLNARRPPATGTTEPGSTVAVTVLDMGGTPIAAAGGPATVDPSGNWTFTPLADLPDGTYTFRAVATDGLNNTAMTDRAFKVDATAPMIATTNPTGVSANTMPTISGTSSDVGGSGIARIELTVTGPSGFNLAEVLTPGSGIDAGTGMWSFAVPSALVTGGPYVISAKVFDGAGNNTTATMTMFSVDPNAPMVAITSPANMATVTTPRPTVSGTATGGSMVQLFVDGMMIGAPVTADSTSGVWNVDLSSLLSSDLSEGAHSIKAVATGPNGLTAETTVNVTIDTKASVVIDMPADGTQTTASPVIVGKADPGSTVAVTIDGNAVGNATADSAGNWMLQVAGPLADGAHQISVTATDPNNHTATATRSFMSLGTGAGDGGLGDGGLGDGSPGGNQGDGGLVDGSAIAHGGGVSGGALKCSVDHTAGRGASRAAIALLVGLFLLAMRRRARSKRSGARPLFLGILAVGLAFAGATSVAEAQGRVGLDQFHLGETTEDGFALSRPIDRGHGKFGVQIAGDYAYAPLVFEDQQGDKDTQRLKIIDHQLVGRLVLSVGLWDRVVLFAGLPVNFWMHGQSFETIPGPDKLNIGDALAGFRIRLAGKRDDAGAIALQFTGTAPTAKTADKQSVYSGEQGFTAHPELLLEGRPGGGVLITANVGVRLREKQAIIPTLTTSHELTYRLGFTIPLVREVLNLHIEGYGRSELQHFGDRERSPIEAIGGLKVFPGKGWMIGAAAGPGLTRGYGAPQVRGVLTLGWADPVEKPKPKAAPPPPIGDTDGDGLMDDVDKCPRDPEDQDGFEDSDGCPDPDNDKDGVLDAQDKCPREPEDKDGFEDADGCPDPDNDQDGMLDADDKCPNEAEDKDGFEDEDGCPDPDNDKDGVPDTQDKCPLAPGRPEDDGCPKNVRIEGDRILILQRVEFATNKATIRPESFPVLEDVRLVLETNKQIRRVRVEGHTDSRGNDKKNMVLSQKRADSVKQWLVTRGIEESRLESQGFGETRPIADNKTKAGKQTNRRVEFYIVDPAPSSAVTPDGSGSTAAPSPSAAPAGTAVPAEPGAAEASPRKRTK